MTLPASERALVNTWNQLVAFGGDRIAILYHGWGGSRSMQCPEWIVMRIRNGKEIVTDPKAAWYNRGKKVFHVHGPVREGKPRVYAEALAWVIKHYGQREFVRNRWGDMVEREVNERFPLPPRKRKKVKP